MVDLRKRYHFNIFCWVLLSTPSAPASDKSSPRPSRAGPWSCGAEERPGRISQLARAHADFAGIDELTDAVRRPLMDRAAIDALARDDGTGHEAADGSPLCAIVELFRVVAPEYLKQPHAVTVGVKGLPIVTEALDKGQHKISGAVVGAYGISQSVAPEARSLTHPLLQNVHLEPCALFAPAGKNRGVRDVSGIGGDGRLRVVPQLGRNRDHFIEGFGLLVGQLGEAHSWSP